MTETPLATLEDLGDRIVVTNRNEKARNALSPELYATLHEAFELATREARITSVILTGAGGFFCSGGNLNSLLEAQKATMDERVARIDDLQNLIRAFKACPKPVIAAVEGGAAGAGASLAFACDFIVSASEAPFIAAYVKAGLAPDGGLTSTMMARLPQSLVAQMCLLAEPVSAARLYELGAITVICETGHAMAEAQKLADKLAASPTATVALIKGLVNSAADLSLDAQLDAERDAMATAMGGVEAGEGISAFLGKRKPDFASVRGK